MKSEMVEVSFAVVAQSEPTVAAMVRESINIGGCCNRLKRGRVRTLVRVESS